MSCWEQVAVAEPPRQVPVEESSTNARRREWEQYYKVCAQDSQLPWKRGAVYSWNNQLYILAQGPDWYFHLVGLRDGGFLTEPRGLKELHDYVKTYPVGIKIAFVREHV